MRSFRKRLLVLIIGLVIVTQTVTLIAVLMSMRRTVETRAAEQLRSGGTLAEHLIRYRAGQLANGVAVLAADFGFREAVASGDSPTILSAARNNAQRIGADMVLLLDTRGRVLVSTAPAAAAAGSLESLLEDAPEVREQPNFRVLGGNRTSSSSRRSAPRRRSPGWRWASWPMTPSPHVSATWSAQRSRSSPTAPTA